MFNRILGKNLFSWESLDYEVTSGVSLIDGFNVDDNTSEGSGKSSVLNIMCWTLFGKVPKEANIDDVIREGQKNAVGQVNLENGFKIIRSRKPNDLYLVDPEGNKRKGKDAKETQQYVIKMIGMSFETFCQTLYFSQSYPKKFVTASEIDKAKILSEIQDLSKFDRAKKQATTQASDIQKQVTALEISVEKDTRLKQEFASTEQFLTNLIDSFEESKDVELGELAREAENLETVIEECTKELLLVDEQALEEAMNNCKEMNTALTQKKAELKFEISQAGKPLEAYNREMQAIQRESSQLDRRIKQLVREIQEIEKAEDSCPVCGGPLGEAHKKKVELKLSSLAKELEKVQSELEALGSIEVKAPIPRDTQEIEGLLKEIDHESSEVVKQFEELNREAREYNNLTQLVDQKSKELQKVIAKMEVVDAKEPTQEREKLVDTQSKIKNIEKKIKADVKKLKDLTKLYHDLKLLSKGFKEVKSYVFQGLLADLSKKSTDLAQQLFEIPVSIEFNNESEEGGLSKIITNVTLDGVVRPIGLLSGGQERRVQIAVDLALAKIVASRSENPINFRAFDEPMINLSEASMQKVVKLLENLDGTTILIEHNSVVKSIVDRVFSVELRDGVSRNAS